MSTKAKSTKNKSHNSRQSVDQAVKSICDIMRRGNVTIIIPNPHDGEIGVGFLTRLLRQAGITREEWLGAS